MTSRLGTGNPLTFFYSVPGILGHMIGLHNGSSQSLENVQVFGSTVKKTSVKKLGKKKSMQSQFTSVTLSLISTHFIHS